MKYGRVLLTGASAGIGRAIADRLTERGYQVWGTSRNLARLPAHANFHPVELDLGDMDSIRSGVTRALEESGGFDVLINNAGSGIFAPLVFGKRSRLCSNYIQFSVPVYCASL